MTNIPPPVEHVLRHRLSLPYRHLITYILLYNHIYALPHRYTKYHNTQACLSNTRTLCHLSHHTTTKVYHTTTHSYHITTHAYDSYTSVPHHHTGVPHCHTGVSWPHQHITSPLRCITSSYRHVTTSVSHHHTSVPQLRMHRIVAQVFISPHKCLATSQVSHRHTGIL